MEETNRPRSDATCRWGRRQSRERRYRRYLQSVTTARKKVQHGDLIGSDCRGSSSKLDARED